MWISEQCVSNDWKNPLIVSGDGDRPEVERHDDDAGRAGGADPAEEERQLAWARRRGEDHEGQGSRLNKSKKKIFIQWQFNKFELE